MTITVGKMIQMLGRFDPTLPLLVRGYEGGYDDARVPLLTFASPRGYDSYSGKYEDIYNPYLKASVEEQKAEFLASDWIDEEEREGVFDAVVIER